MYCGGQIALHKDYIHLNSHQEGIRELVSYILANSSVIKLFGLCHLHVPDKLLLLCFILFVTL